MAGRLRVRVEFELDEDERRAIAAHQRREGEARLDDCVAFLERAGAAAVEEALEDWEDGDGGDDDPVEDPEEED